MFDQKPDLGPAKAFIQKYAESKLVKETYNQMARYYSYQAPKEEAAKFFPEYATKFPNDPRVLDFWLAKNANQESAVAMAETALKLQPENAYILQQVAAAYVKMGKDDKALAIFGPEYIKPKSGDTNALYGYARFWAMQGKIDRIKKEQAEAKK